MRTVAALVVLSSLALASSIGCKKDDPPRSVAAAAPATTSSSDDGAVTKSKTKSKSKDDDDKRADDDDKGKASAGDDDPAASKDDDKADDKKADDDSAPVAGPRTPAPKPGEWSAAADVIVTDAKKLGCETRMVREWLRVSCRGKDDTGGATSAVNLTKGEKEALIFANKSVSSVVVPFEPGTDFAATFSWEDKSETFTAKWPQGKPRPDPVGAFALSNDPGVAHDEGISKRLCDCFMKLASKPTCDELEGGGDPDCDRTYQNDCEKLVECSRGEPGVAAKCQPGWRNGGAAFRCFRECGAGKPACKASEECSDEVTGGQGATVCNPKE